jgi:plasmid maintenance system antidote protein VapI
MQLSLYFGNSAQFWLGLQNDYDVEKFQNEKKKEWFNIRKITVIF